LDGWPDWNPNANALTEILAKHPHAGIGVNLGGSGLVDLEGDSPEAEGLLDDPALAQE
jgi:hypothetical protein